MRSRTNDRRTNPWTARRAALLALLALSAAVPARAVTVSHAYPKGWNLVSVPVVPTNPAPAAVYDEVTPLRIYDERGGFIKGPSETGFRNPAPGLGHWMLMAQATTVAVTGNEPSRVVEFRASVAKGWNTVGTPWISRVSWDDARVSMTDGTTTRSLSQAVATGWIQAELRAFDAVGGAYVSIPDNLSPAVPLMPMVGYELLSSIDGQLIFSPPPPDTAAPIVDIESPTEPDPLPVLWPQDGQEIRTLTPVIGTVEDDNLASWTLAIRNVELGTWVPIATGSNTVQSAFVGNLDPTLQLNGVAELRLQATDVGGRSAEDFALVAIGGDNKLGNFRLTFVDLEVPFAGIPISIRRTYDTRRRSANLDFGWGWQIEVTAAGKYLRNRPPGSGWSFTDNGLECIDTDPTAAHVVEIRFGDREFYRFAFEPKVPAAGSTIPCVADGKFVQIAGIPGATLHDINYPPSAYPKGVPLISDGNASWLEEEDDNLPVYDPREVRLTTRDGRKFELSLLGNATQPKGLYKIEDRVGNIVDITKTSVTWRNPNVAGASKTIQIVRSGGRVTKLVDPEGYEIPYEYDASGDLASVTDRTLNKTRFTYVAGHFLDSIIDPLGNMPIRPRFDGEGRLIAWLDADGNSTNFVTDAANNAVTVTDREGASTSYVYGVDGYLKDAFQPGGITTSYTYNVRGDVLTERDPLGHTTTYAYEEVDSVRKGNLLSLTTPENETTTFAYGDAANPGSVSRMTQPEGNLTQYVYDQVTGLLEREVNGVGMVKDSTYNALGKLESESLFYDPGLGTADAHTRYVYDSFGNMTKRTDALGNAVDYTYDGNHRQKTRTAYRTINPHADPAHHTVAAEVTTTIYDPQGRVRYRIDPLGATSETRYDATGRPQFEIDPLMRETELIYDARNNLMKRIDPDGRYEEYQYDLEGRPTTTFDRHMDPRHFLDRVYDDVGRLVRTTYPEDNVGGPTESADVVAYDPAGRVVKQFDPRFPDGSVFTRMEYDGGARLRATYDPLGNATERRYDRNGRLVKVIDRAGHETSFTYDLANRREKTIYHDGTYIRTGYDARGRSVTQRDQNGKVTEYGYDALGRLVSVTTPMNHTWTYSYDEVGNQIVSTDANQHTTRTTYDAHGRPLTRTLPLGQTESFTYNAVGSRLTRTDMNGVTTTYRYDIMNRLETIDYPPDPTTEDVHFTYTPSGRRKSMTDGLGVTVYEYDLRERYKSVTDPFMETVGFAYDMAGNRTALSTPYGTTTFTFDARGMLTTVVAPGNPAPFTYSYDDDGKKTRLTFPSGAYTTWSYDELDRIDVIETLKSDGVTRLKRFDYTVDAAGNRTRVTELDREVTWTYDEEYKLIAELIQVGGQPAKSIVFGYDDVGNRVQRHDDGVLTQDVAYDANDRLAWVNGNAIASDPNGNQLRGPATGHAYGWDIENRLTSSTRAGQQLSYRYNGDGVLLLSEEDAETTRLLVDPVTQPTNVLAEFPEGLHHSMYVFGDGLLAQTSNGVSLDICTDVIGTPRETLDINESTVGRYSYEAFGSATETAGADLRYGFAGARRSGDGLYSFGGRWLDASQGRFLSRDISRVLDGPTPPNPYAYGRSSPVVYVDHGGFFDIPQINVSMAIHGTLTAIDVVSVGLNVAAGNYGSALIDLATGPLPLPVSKLNIVFKRLGAAGEQLIRGELWLYRHDRWAHIVETHVDKSFDWLFDRAKKLGSASAFPDDDVARNAISAALLENSDRLDEFYRSAETEITVFAEFGGSIGQGFVDRVWYPTLHRVGVVVKKYGGRLKLETVELYPR